LRPARSQKDVNEGRKHSEKTRAKISKNLKLSLSTSEASKAISNRVIIQHDNTKVDRCYEAGVRVDNLVDPNTHIKERKRDGKFSHYCIVIDKKELADFRGKHSSKEELHTRAINFIKELGKKSQDAEKDNTMVDINDDISSDEKEDEIVEPPKKLKLTLKWAISSQAPKDQ
jgi:hypothetical protein